VLVVTTSPTFFILGRRVIFDMLLALFVSSSIICGFVAEGRDGTARRRWWAASALAAGLGTLVKGPVGFVVPGLVLIVFNLIERRPAAIRRMLAPINFVVLLGVVLPWFIGLSIQRPDFPRYGLIEETFQRYTTDSFHRVQPWYYYGPQVFGGFF